VIAQGALGFLDTDSESIRFVQTGHDDRQFYLGDVGYMQRRIEDVNS
jgi:hypothetical protein